MRLVLVSVGRMKAGPERLLFERYGKRLADGSRSAGFTGFDAREFDKSRARSAEMRQADEANAILSAVPRGGALTALDERGQPLTSEAFAAEIGAARDAGRSAYVVAIGGPDGLDGSLRAAASRIVSFGAMTWPHQLVRVMAAEQLYRALTILAGHPYHRRSTP